MSRRTAKVEDFDDDTDLPLPSRPLPNTGTRGPLLQQVDSDEEDDLETGNEPTAGPATTPQFQPRPPPPPQTQYEAPIQMIDKLKPDQKTWTCIYPIYIDAKRPYGTGSRRLPREKSVWWPLSKDITDAAVHLRLMTIHEPNKRHPKDWDNPGRVRVELKRNGRFMNPAIKSKKQLLEAISFQIQRIKHDNIPKPPYNTSPLHTNTTPNPNPKPAKSKSKTSTPATASKSKTQGRRRLPIPPSPHPPLANRLSPYSPALVSGVLIETVKAGMNAEGAGAGGATGPGAGPGAGGPGGAGAGKGKRKVVRVRG